MRSPALDQSLQNEVNTLQQILLGVSWASQRLLARQVETFGLTVPQYVALRALHRQGPQGCSMSTLAEAAQQVPATMTGIIDRLAEGGLAERRPDPHDRRTVRVLLTPSGKRLLEETEADQRQRLERFFEKLSPTERSELIRLMTIYLETTLNEIEA